MKAGQLPVRDGRIVPAEPDGVVWSKERQAGLDAGRAKRAAKEENNPELLGLSEEQRISNKAWVAGIRDGSIAPTVVLRPSERGLCVSCYEPLEQEQHTSCRCWQCLKPAKQRVTQEKYDAALERALGHPVPPKNCTCAPTNRMPVRCPDCVYRGSLRLFPNKPVSLRTAIIEPGHNDAETGNLLPGRECLCRSCVDRQQYVPGAGRCASCTGFEEWKNTQHLTGFASTENPYRKEALETEQEAVDFIIKDQKFIYHANTRRRNDALIKQQRLVQRANDSFFISGDRCNGSCSGCSDVGTSMGCDVVLVKVDPENMKQFLGYGDSQDLKGYDFTEFAYTMAGGKEKEQQDFMVDWRLDPKNKSSIEKATTYEQYGTGTVGGK